jgi:hypothetical protein
VHSDPRSSPRRASSAPVFLARVRDHRAAVAPETPSEAMRGSTALPPVKAAVDHPAAWRRSANVGILPESGRALPPPPTVPLMARGHYQAGHAAPESTLPVPHQANHSTHASIARPAQRGPALVGIVRGGPPDHEQPEPLLAVTGPLA